METKSAVLSRVKETLLNYNFLNFTFSLTSQSARIHKTLIIHFHQCNVGIKASKQFSSNTTDDVALKVITEDLLSDLLSPDESFTGVNMEAAKRLQAVYSTPIVQFFLSTSYDCWRLDQRE